MIVYEKLSSINHPFVTITPVLWKCGNVCGLDHVELNTVFGSKIIWPNIY